MFLKIGLETINFDKVCYFGTNENNLILSFDGEENIYFPTRTKEEAELFIKTINKELQAIDIVSEIAFGKKCKGKKNGLD